MEQCQEVNIDATIMLFLEFRDGFSLCTSMTTTKDSLVLHTITFQSSNTTMNNLNHAYPIALGCKNKDSIIIETT